MGCSRGGMLPRGPLAWVSLCVLVVAVSSATAQLVSQSDSP